MKKIIVFLAILLLYSLNASAQETTAATTTANDHQLRDDIWLHIITQPLYGMLQLNIHESSHVMAGVSTGGTLQKYEPYPHFGEKDHFYLGNNTLTGNYNKAFYEIAPHITNITLFTVSDLTLSRMDPASPTAPALYAIMFWNFIDFTTNVNGCSDFNDTVKFSNQLHLNKTLVRVVGNGIAVIGAARLIDRGYQVLFSKKEKPKPVSVDTNVKLSFDGEQLNISKNF